VSDAAPQEPRGRSRAGRLMAELSVDALVALVWAALTVAIVLFSGVVSQFLYVDF
jgi:hypothetical protein